MKKSTLALLTTAIAFSPLAALAQDTQTSIQTNSNSAAVVGNGNGVVQNATQNSIQKSIDLDSYLPAKATAIKLVMVVVMVGINKSSIYFTYF